MVYKSAFPVGFLKLACRIILVLAIAIVDVDCADHQLKLVTNGANPVSTPVQFTSSAAAVSPTPTKYTQTTNFAGKQKSQICVVGMWALYDQPKFGEGIDDDTKVGVISAKGTSLTSCTGPNAVAQLPNVKSLYFLGAVDPATNGISIFTESSFLGGRWDPAMPAGGTGTIEMPAKMTGFRMGSFAITGSANKWRICGDSNCNNAICIDMGLQTGGNFLVRNSLTDTSTTWPRIVRKIEIGTSCGDGDDTTPPAQLSAGRRKRDISPVHDFVEILD